MSDAPRTWAGGRFVALALLGRGSGGVVYRVHDRDNDVVVALKTLAEPDAESVYRLKQEFRACAGVRHRNLVELYELFAADDECFFTMELIEGVDCVRYLRDDAGADGARLIRFFAVARQLVEGLAVLHAAGRLHRDVKPSNALVDGRGRTVLLDFGFMVPFGGRLLALERSDTAAGSLAYIAPEVLWGEPPTPASDWYSVGVVCHEALSGGLPFDAPPARQLSHDPPPRPRPLERGVPPPLAELIEALLSPDPARRPGASDIARVIDSCSAEQRLAAAPPAPLADETPFVGRQDELRRLRQAFDDLEPRHTSVVEVVGASGIGKSELVRQFLSSLERAGDVVALSGRCHPYETVPYRAFDGVMDALSRFLASLPERDAMACVPLHAGAMARLFPVLGRVPLFAPSPARDHREEAAEVRRNGFAAIRELLGRLGAERRLVLWIDDAQWSDADSAALARAVFGGAEAPRLLLILSRRDDAGGAIEDLAAFAPRAGARTAIALGPLGDEAATELAAHIGGGRVADTAAVVSEAAGSPFLVAQLVRAALRAESAAAMPSSIGELLQARAGGLGQSARRLLEIVSVAGQPIELRLAAAAGALAGNGRHELITLQEERLLRLAAGARVEAYHDRIREAVVAGLPPAALRECHRGLAQALVREPVPDAAALHRHFLGAGERGPAADWAIEAAERADRALAFGEAAAFYRAALELREASAADRRALRIKLADALVNAGRGAEAAPLFIAATDGGDARAGLDLRRRAAEQYLQTGRLEEGVACLRALLGDLDLAYPDTEGAAGRAIALGLARVALRSALPARRRRPIDERTRQRIEVARAAAKGLAMVDPLRGLRFAVGGLDLALRSADPYLIARELAGMGATLVPVGPPLRGWGRRMIHRARAMAEALGDDYLLGFTAIVQAQEHMVEGRWEAMLRCCDEGAAILRDRCRGVSWELAIANAAAERAVEELGRPAEMLRRAEGALPRARETADIVRICSCVQYIGVAHYLQGRPGEARAAAHQAREIWPDAGFQMQHFYTLRIEAYAALLEERAEEALRMVRERWEALARSQLLRHVLIGLDAHLLAARCHLAAAQRSRAPALLERARWHARQVRRAGMPPALGLAEMVNAVADLIDGERAEAAHRLDLASMLFAHRRMALAEAAALHLLAQTTAHRDDAAQRSAAAFSAAGITDVASHMRLHGVG